MERQQELKQQRDMLQALVDRVGEDPHLRKQLREDPVGVLQSEGLSRDIIGDFLREEGYADRDPNDKNLKAKEKDAIEAARWCQTCCISCLATSECRLTVG